MAGPKWEDLQKDCLVNILTRVGTESLLYDIPFVCKSWYRASLDPSCWKIINFQELPLADEYLKLIINRSQGNATSVMLPTSCPDEVFRYLADKCPALKALYLPSVMGINRSFVLPEVISKWKNLELLKIGRPCIHNMERILEEISLHCKNFCHLEIDNIPIIQAEEASAIVTFLPNIRYLHLRHGVIDQKSLKIILQGCKKLVHLDVRDSLLFECDDQLLELASHIANFQHVVSEPSCVDYNRYTQRILLSELISLQKRLCLRFYSN
ncbi:hypothetical protein CMV_019692 [Castanea mollissima]|uniref:F-box/LRR-repeat protein n=1 Tax=Castanea mollissima TaxID=60419 RepID=A0A8J4QXQ6_9ROSI|nr:hypothetical protein CMV_019692 [Castanea mollissima]